MRRPTTTPINAEEAARLAEPYAQQQALLALLERAHAHNRAVLERYGYPCPRPRADPTDRSYLGALRISAAITEPEAQAAAAVIDAVGKVYRGLFKDDKCALAHAAIWLGLMIATDDETSRRSAAGKARAAKAREKRRNHWTEAVIQQAYDELHRYHDQPSQAQVETRAWNIANNDKELSEDRITPARVRSWYADHGISRTQ